MHTLGFSEAKKEHWGWGPPVVKPNFLSLPTSSPFKSSFCKWHHQFSHLLKPKSLKSSLTYFSLPQSIQQQICCCHFWNMFTVRPVFSTLVVSTEVSYLECSICCLNDFSSSTIVLLNSVFLLAARTVVKKKKKSRFSVGAKIKSHVCILPTRSMTSPISCPTSLSFAHSIPYLLTSQLFFQHTKHACCSVSQWYFFYLDYFLSLLLDVSLPLGYSQMIPYPEDYTLLSDIVPLFTFYPFSLLYFSPKHFSLLNIAYLFALSF